MKIEFVEAEACVLAAVVAGFSFVSCAVCLLQTFLEGESWSFVC